MPAYNTTFELSVEDLELIEAVLYRKKAVLAQERLEAIREEEEVSEEAPMLDRKIRDIAGLLGRLHNQKVFYRPKRGVYLGG